MTYMNLAFVLRYENRKLLDPSENTRWAKLYSFVRHFGIKRYPACLKSSAHNGKYNFGRHQWHNLLHTSNCEIYLDEMTAYYKPLGDYIEPLVISTIAHESFHSALSYCYGEHTEKNIITLENIYDTKPQGLMDK